MAEQPGKIWTMISQTTHSQQLQLITHSKTQEKLCIKKTRDQGPNTRFQLAILNSLFKINSGITLAPQDYLRSQK